MDFFQQFIKIFILCNFCWQCQAYMAFLMQSFANCRQNTLIHSSMNLNVEPCSNFYDYACGNWDKTYTGAGTYFFEPLTMINKKVNEEMHQLLDQLIVQNKPKFIQKVQRYYKSCANLQTIETKHYLTWLEKNDQFDWPTRINWRENIKIENHQYQWEKTLAKMRIYGFNYVFIQLKIINELNDVNSFIIDLNKPDDFEPLTRESYDLIMQTLPAKKQPEISERVWQKVKNLEENLTVLNGQQFESKSVIKFKDLPFDWLKNYVRIILNQTVINPDMKFYIQNQSYMLALDKLLQKYCQRLLNFYLEIRFLGYLYSNGPDDISAVDCLASTRSLMPTAMHWLYEFRHPELRRDFASIFEIFNKLRQQFAKTIQENKYGFDSKLVKQLQSKLQNMKLKLNNIPRAVTVATLKRFYQDLDLDENDFYGNHLKLLRFNFNAHRTLLDKSKTILGFTYLEDAYIATSSSPYFRDDVNTIFVPLTLLRPPIYNAHLDEIYKYSSLGFLIAHEMFHGFDERGLSIDANGIESLISFKANNLFNASFNCLLNSNPTIINEKIADISGLRYAYHAYFDNHPKALNSTEIIFGHEVTKTQMFFLNFAQFFCGSSIIEKVESVRNHGSGRDRLMDAIAHFPEFAKAYQCSRNRRDSNLPKTCHLW